VNQITCPQCGAQNRLGAKFCKSCRVALPQRETPSKNCPQCSAPNRVNAKFCARCGYVFRDKPIAQTAIPNWRILSLLVGIASVIVCLCIALLLIVKPFDSASTQSPVVATAIATSIVRNSAPPSPASSPSSPPSLTILPLSTSTPTTRATVPPSVTPTVSGDPLDRAKRGTVYISVPIDSNPNARSIGSGSVITKRGHILTNNHLFVDDNGKPYNSRGDVFISFPPRGDLKARVEQRYRATIVAVDQNLDLALLRITALSNGQPLPTDLELGVIPIGDSDKMDSPNPITVLGYPGVGGTTLTITTGTIAGFFPDGSIEEGFFKTATEINAGNSGGPALNAANELIGVVTAARIRDTSQGIPGKIGLIRPIKFAQNLIAMARREAGE